MKFLRFTIFSFIGSFIWCALLAWGGYLFGQNWEELRGYMRPFDIPIAIVIVAALAYYVYRHIRKRREQAATESRAQRGRLKGSSHVTAIAEARRASAITGQLRGPSLFRHAL